MTRSDGNPGVVIAKRRLGITGLRVSEIGLGTAPLGNLFHRWTDADARGALDAAFHAGISLVDTAPYYGFGLSERRVGDGVRELADVVVSTKVGRLLKSLPAHRGDAERDGFLSALPFEAAYDYSYDGVMRSWEASQQRMGLARIDILLMHDLGTLVHGDAAGAMFAQATAGGGFRALEELRNGGAIAAYGLGVNEWQVCLQAMDHTPLDVVLLAGRYTLLEQDSLEEFLPACLKRGVGVIAGGVYNSGILATGTGAGRVPYYNYAPAPPDIVERVRRIESVCNAHGVSLAAAALQFVLAHPAIASAILGLGNRDEVAAALQAQGAPIPPPFWTELKSQRLVRDDAPVPGA